MTSAATLAPLLARVCRSHHWQRKPGGRPGHVNAPLSDALIDAHLNGGYAVGACCIAPGDSTTRCALLDLDSHKGEITWPEMIEIAQVVIAALAEANLHAITFRSSGGSGLHLILLWQDHQDAYSVREALKIALGKCNLVSGVGGVAKGEVEIFPKQNSVPADGFGSMFVLPLNGQSCALLEDTLTHTAPSLIKWRASDPVTVREKPDVPIPTTTRVEGDRSIIKAALDAIPNSGAQQLDYDAWRNIVFAVHSATDGDDIGLALVREFSARASVYNPDFLDTRVWPYARSDRPDGITIRSLYAAAAAYGWEDPTVKDAFEVSAPGSNDPFTQAHNEQGSGNAGATRFRALTVAEFTAGKPPPWVIKGVLPQAALLVVFGESASGKTFFALDIAAAIARGGPWRGRRVTQGRVVYICAEGAHGFRNRVRAYMHERQLDDLDLLVIPDTPNFMQTGDIMAVLDSLRACGPVSMVVVDTFAQVMPGANENSGEDVGKAIYHCQQIHRQTGALVMLIHHAGKDASKGARGWSGLRAAADAEIEITRIEHDRVAQITKLKEGEDGAEFGFRLHPVIVGQDDEGEDISSCVIEHTDALPKSQRSKREARGDIEKIVARAFDDLELAGDVVHYGDLKIAAKDQIPQDPNQRDQRGVRVARAIESLVARGFFRRAGDGVERVRVGV